MSRDIPESVPDEIATLIYKNWGDMKAFSESCGLKYSTVHSVLARSSHKTLEITELLADVLKVSIDVIAEVLTNNRKDEFLAIMRGAEFKTITELAKAINVPPTYIHELFGERVKLSKLSNVMHVSRGLGLSLTEFRRLYSAKKKLAS